MFGALSPAIADEAPEAAHSPFKLSGFATLGATYNDNREAGVIFSSTQKHPADHGLSANLDSVAGLQLDWQLLPGTSVVVQGVARAGESFEPKLRMGYLRQRLGGDAAVRVGRLRNPIFFDSDVAEIGYAYLMSRPPIPLYNSINSVDHLDGADVQWRHALGNMALMVQGYYGGNKYKHRFYNLNPVQVADVELRGIAGIAISAALPNVTLRVSHTKTSSYTMQSSQISQLNAGLAQVSGGLRAMAADPRLPAAMASALANQAQQVSSYANPFDGKPTYTSIGFDSNLADWRLLGEWTQLDTRSAMAGKYQGYHLTLGYSMGEFTPYVSYARQSRKSPAFTPSALSPTGTPVLDGAIAQLNGALGRAAQFADISMRSASVGVRWDFRENMALKLQYDHLKTPSPAVHGYLAVSSLPFHNKVNLLTFSLDLAF